MYGCYTAECISNRANFSTFCYIIPNGVIFAALSILFRVMMSTHFVFLLLLLGREIRERVDQPSLCIVIHGLTNLLLLVGILLLLSGGLFDALDTSVGGWPNTVSLIIAWCLCPVEAMVIYFINSDIGVKACGISVIASVLALGNGTGAY